MANGSRQSKVHISVLRDACIVLGSFSAILPVFCFGVCESKRRWVSMKTALPACLYSFPTAHKVATSLFCFVLFFSPKCRTIPHHSFQTPDAQFLFDSLSFFHLVACLSPYPPPTSLQLFFLETVLSRALER